MTTFLSRGEAVLSLRGAGDSHAVVRVKPAGAARQPHAVGLEPQIARTNYLIGDDPRQWHTDVASYGRVLYPNIYPGIDLIYRGTQRRLEYDLMVAKGAEPNQIRLAISGADAVELDSQGRLILHTAAGDITQPTPVAYQEETKGRERIPVDARYVLLPRGHARADRATDGLQEVGIAVAAYDRARPLIIDPVIGYSTFLGDAGSDIGYGIAVDGAGNSYVTGRTESTFFPGAGGGFQSSNAGGVDAFVTKINAAGTAIVYSTFLGDDSGGEAGDSIAVDNAGNAYVFGTTSSTSLPGVTAGSIQPANGGGGYDVFLTKLNAAGNGIVYSTFLGAIGLDAANSIVVDSSGSAYVTGQTTSQFFPGVLASLIQPGIGAKNDAFVTKINAAGTAIVYSTFLGREGDDYGSGIAVDSSGNAYVTGQTESAYFPGVTDASLQPHNAGASDAFVTKINAAGTAILYSTFLGGSSYDNGASIAVDSSGNAYVAGATSSPSFPGVTAGSIQSSNGGIADAFVTKISAAGNAIVYSTFLGGSGVDFGGPIAVDSSGNAYLTGITESTTFPGVNAGSIQPTNGDPWGYGDGFVTKLNATGAAILYSTFLGGSDSDRGIGIAVDSSGNAYVTGYTRSTTFPGVNAASIQPANEGDDEVFVAKVSSFPFADGFETGDLLAWAHDPL